MIGRPKKPEGETKEFMLRVRMTQDEKALLEKAARTKSLQMSSWVRSEMLALARRIVGKK